MPRVLVLGALVLGAATDGSCRLDPALPAVAREMFALPCRTAGFLFGRRRYFPARFGPAIRASNSIEVI